MVTAVPLQALMPEADGIAVRRWNQGPGLCRSALCSGVVKPDTKSSEGALQVVEPHINIALCVVSVLRDNVRPRTRQECHRHLPDAKIPVLHAAAVSAHVQGIE